MNVPPPIPIGNPLLGQPIVNPVPPNLNEPMHPERVYGLYEKVGDEVISLLHSCI